MIYGQKQAEFGFAGTGLFAVLSIGPAFNRPAPMLFYIPYTRIPWVAHR
jgi:hypothetical protein